MIRKYLLLTSWFLVYVYHLDIHSPKIWKLSMAIGILSSAIYDIILLEIFGNDVPWFFEIIEFLAYVVALGFVDNRC